MPGFLNDLASALRNRTATRVYGTPFYEDELKKREIAGQLAELGLQQKQFETEHQPESFEADVQSKLANAGLRDSTKGLNAAKTAKINNENSPERLEQEAEARDLDKQLKEARLQAMQAKTPMEQELAKAKIADLHDRMAKRVMGGGSSQSKPQPLKLGKDASGNQVIIDLTNNKTTPLNAPGGGTLGVAPTAQTQNRREQATIIQNAADDLLKQLSDKDVLAGIGPAAGRLGKFKETVGILDPKVRNFRTGLKSFASLLPILHGFRGGTQLAHQFEAMIGDINQGPEQIKAALKQIKNFSTGINGAEAGGGGEVEWTRDASGKPVMVKR